MNITDSDPTRASNLTQSEAEHRAALITEVEYDLALSLQADSPDYEGDCRIRFRHQDPQAGTFLDFTGGERSAERVCESGRS